MSEIRKNNPFGLILAYTNVREGTALGVRAKEASDAFFPKAADVNTIVDYMDDDLIERYSSHGFWLIARQHFLDRGVDMRQLILMENYWVRAVWKRDFGVFSKGVSKIVRSSDIDDDALSALKFGFQVAEAGAGIAGLTGL